jgi:cytochrome c oxidase subunit 1
LPLQHLLWFLGHPEVHILILPAFGLISEIISKSTQCIIYGRDSMIIALLLIAFLGCIVRGHHMFMVGSDIVTLAYYTTATSITAIPTGIKIYNWLATLWTGCLYWITSQFFIIGFLFSFSFGGFTGLIPANCIIDTLLHDSYFIVGHFHFVLSLGAVYTIFSAFYTYFNYFSSYPYINELIGRWNLFFFSFSSNLISFSMHSLGLMGFPRRIFDYPVVFFRFNRVQSFAWSGISISLFLFLTII